MIVAAVRRPAVVAFDVVETLFSLEPLGARLQDAGLPPGSLEKWFSRFLRDAFALDGARLYVPFREVAAGTLQAMLVEHGQNAAPDTIAGILQTFGELPPHPDVGPAFQRLSEAGIRIIAVTNGSAATTERLIRRASLEGFVDRIVSVDEVQHWKPRREVYLHAAKTAGLPAKRLALVAAHPWDVLGAHQAGLVTGFVERRERMNRAMPAPTVSADNLVQVVERLLELPR